LAFRGQPGPIAQSARRHARSSWAAGRDDVPHRHDCQQLGDDGYAGCALSVGHAGRRVYAACGQHATSAACGQHATSAACGQHATYTGGVSTFSPCQSRAAAAAGAFGALGAT